MSVYEPSTIAVGNFFLRKQKMGLIRLIKLCYVSQGWFAAFYDEMLMHEQMEAANFGPIINSLHEQFSEFGSKDKIDRQGHVYTYDKWNVESRSTPYPQEEQAIELLEQVWKTHRHLTQVQLQHLCREDGGAWDTIRKQHPEGEIPMGTDIPIDLLRAEFIAKANPQEAT